MAAQDPDYYYGITMRTNLPWMLCDEVDQVWSRNRSKVEIAVSCRALESVNRGNVRFAFTLTNLFGNRPNQVLDRCVDIVKLPKHHGTFTARCTLQGPK